MEAFLFYIFIISVLVLTYYFGKFIGWSMHQPRADKVREVDDVINADVRYDQNGLIKYDLVYLEKEGEYTKVYNAEIINETDIIKKG
jgi:hypothetical protein